MYREGRELIYERCSEWIGDVFFRETFGLENSRTEVARAQSSSSSFNLGDDP